MVANILPSLNLPANIKTELFTYIIPKKIENIIKIGQIVEINFRNKKTQGIIMEIENNPENIEKLKEINKIIQQDIQITEMQLEIINYISQNYYTSKAKALKTVIPQLPKRNL